MDISGEAAVRVVLTLDDLAELLGLAPGHRLEAVAETPEGTRPGILVTLTLGAGLPGLNAYNSPGEPIRIVRLREYRERCAGPKPDPFAPKPPVRLVPRGTEDLPEKPGVFGGDLIAAGCMGPDRIDWARWDRLNPAQGRKIPWADLDAAECVGPDGVINWSKWDRLNRAQNTPPPPVPPDMPRPVTKSDPPIQIGQPPSYLPSRAPVTGSDPATWPKFPGEELLPQIHGDDPGDEDIHTGGPR